MVAGQVRVREGQVLGVDEDALRARAHAAPSVCGVVSKTTLGDVIGCSDHAILARDNDALALCPRIGAAVLRAQGIWKAFRAGAGGVVTKTLRLQAAVNPTRTSSSRAPPTCARRCSTARNGPT